MSYQSKHFLIFAAVVLLLYYLVGRKRQKYVLLLANIYFFVISGIENIPVILVSMVCSFFAGRKIGTIYSVADEKLAACQTPAEKKQVRADAKAQAKKHLLWAMAVVLGILVLYKSAVLILGGINKTNSTEPISLPVFLGISYYTFMAISYMLDIYWRKAKAEPSFVSYAVFLSYFLHIVQGPIDRNNAIGPQINAGAKLNYKNITFGAQLALWGLFKKMVIADRLSLFADTVFGNFHAYDGAVLLVAGIFSALRLYCNFSGCMDIVRGISQMFGIEIAKNFDRPFFAKSVAEFWRRWHMTLGSWFKDYVYMPIAISPKTAKIGQAVKGKFGIHAAKTISVIIPTAIVWLFTGLWHGTGWNYVAWGIYWGTLIICSTVFAPGISKLTAFLRINTKAKSWQLFQMVRTFLLFVVGHVISSSRSVLDALAYLKRIVFDFRFSSLVDKTLYTLGLDRANFLLSLLLIFVLWGVSMLQNKGSVREQISTYNIVFRWVLYYGLIFAILIFGIYGPGFNTSDFVYGNF